MRISTVQKILFVILVLWAGTFLTSFHFTTVPDDPPKISITINASSNSVNYGFHLGKRSPKAEEEDATPFPKELTFTLLNWKRKDCLQTIIRRAQDYRDFISEILIGNNNPDVVITAKDFDSPYIPLRVYNFPQNRFFYARYELCLMGTGKYCYFQDDDWENKHLRSLYANFLRYPHLLHTDTNAFVHYLSWAWTFFDPDVNMHTGFSWVGTGGIASKENVRRFTETQVPLLPRESSNLADMYFSTWFNQVPYQLENELVELEQKYGFSSEPGGIKRNKLHITEGVKKLHSILKANSTLFTQEELQPKVEERFTRSPCQDDDCLFTTSLHSFPNPRQIIYEPRWDLETGEHLHSQMFDWKLFVANPYHHAVDNNIETSWMSLSAVKEGSFYGLDFLQPGHYMDIYVDVGHTYQAELVLESSFDGITWLGNDTCAWSREATETGNFHYSLISKCKCNLRYIRFRALQSYSSPLQVFNMHYTDKFRKWKKDTTNVPCGLPTLGANALSTSYSPEHFLPEIGNGEIKVSLVLLHWKRLENIHTIFQHLVPHTFINEYIIWNNNIEIHLNESQMFPEGVPAHISLRIINSPQNVHDFAKYMACSMATNKYCYFQDDDWLNIYLKSQYSQFLRFPDLFHSITIPIINLEHRRWNVYNEAADLHAGFSWLGVGSFIPRHKAEKFLEQLSHIQIKHDEMLQADIFFSYFTNDYPWELSAIAYPLSQKDAWSTSVDQWDIVYSRLSIAATTVLKLLENKDNKVVSRGLPSPSYSMRDVRSPCGDDRCLFLTNIASFPDPEKVVFDGQKTVKEQEQVYNALDWPSNWYWMDNSYERAVDDNSFTCWTSYRVAQVGDYFGLDLLHHQDHTNFTVVLDQDMSGFNVLVSPTAITWDKAEFSVVSARMLSTSVRSYSITLEYPHPFRFIRFEVSDELARLQTHFAVYEVFEGNDVRGVINFGANKVLDPSFEEFSTDDEEVPTNSDWYIQHSGDDMTPNLGNNVENKKTIVSYTGTRSLRFSSSTGTTVSSASQIIDFNQEVPKKVIISAASKAEGVVNMKYPEAGYSLVVDVTYMDGTAKWNLHVSVFSEGTHNWQFKTIYLDESRPLKSIMLHLFFKNHKGTVYFDDVSVQEENIPIPTNSTNT